jgi:hypothetical protein
VLRAAVVFLLQGGSSLVSAMLFGSTKSAVTATSMKPSITLAPFTQVRQGLAHRVQGVKLLPSDPQHVLHLLCPAVLLHEWVAFDVRSDVAVRLRRSWA